MDNLFERTGVWLAKAYAAYGSGVLCQQETRE